MIAVADVTEQFGIDPIGGARHLVTTTWEDGCVTVAGSWTPTTVACSEAAYEVRVLQDADALAEQHDQIAANKVAWEAAHPEYATQLAELAGDYPPPPGA